MKMGLGLMGNMGREWVCTWVVHGLVHGCIGVGM